MHRGAFRALLPVSNPAELALTGQQMSTTSATPIFGVYNVRLKAWAATKTDWNTDHTAPEVMHFRDEQDANEFLAEYGECFDSAAIAAGFPETDQQAAAKASIQAEIDRLYQLSKRASALLRDCRGVTHQYAEAALETGEVEWAELRGIGMGIKRRWFLA